MAGEMEYGSPAATFQRFGGLAATGNVKGALAEVAGSFGLVGVAAGKVAGAAEGLVASFVNLPSTLRGVADSAASMVAQFSPFTSGRYTQALRDMTAVFGEMLMPVVQTATRVVRYLGDTFAGLTSRVQPLISEVFEALEPAFSAAGDVFREVLSAGLLLYDVFKPVVSVLLQGLNPLKLLTDQMKAFATWVNQATVALANVLGVKLPSGFDGASQGKAFVGTSTTSPTALLASLREKSYQLGGGPRNNIPQQQLDVTAKILELLTKTLNEFTPDQIAKKIGEEIARAGDKAVAALSLKMSEIFNQLPAAFAESVRKVLDDMVKKIPGVPGLPVPAGPLGIPAIPGIPNFFNNPRP